MHNKLFFLFKHALYISFRAMYRLFFARFTWGQKLRELIFSLQYILAKETKFYNFEMVWCVENFNKIKSSNITTNNTNTFIKIKDVTLIGGSRFIIHKNQASLDIATSKESIVTVYQNYFLQEELLGTVKYYPEQPDKITIKITNPHGILHGTWISILHYSSNNWMHFLSECAPRMYLAIHNGEKLNFGILYDQDIPEQVLDIIKIISENRPMVAIHPGHNVSIASLLVPIQEATNCCAFWPRPGYTGKGYFSFDVKALQNVRNKILNEFSIIPNASKCIYVNRESQFRHIINKKEVQEFLMGQGFELISSGADMSLKNQIEIFSKASILIAQAGAALANIMFMPKGSIVICLYSDGEFTNTDYFDEYAKIFGIKIIPIYGQIFNPEKYCKSKLLSAQHPMNADFVVPLHKLKETLLTINNAFPLEDVVLR